MISVIICSASDVLLKKVKDNIGDTIGTPFEIISYDNSKGQRGICEIYNQGVSEAKYDILCFVHEDVEFNTIYWGKEVMSAFEGNKRLGLLGVAGSSYKSYAPSGWQGSEVHARIIFINVVQHYKHSGKAEEYKKSEFSTDLPKVAVIDGVWMCGKRDILLEHPFDETLLKKFHGYDLDISLSVGAQFDVCVSSRVTLTHFSEGNFDRDWLTTMLILHKKWKSVLPVNKASLNKKEMKICEKNAFKSFINTMRRNGCSAYSCLRVLNRSGISSRFGLILYFRLLIKCLSA